MKIVWEKQEQKIVGPIIHCSLILTQVRILLNGDENHLQRRNYEKQIYNMF